MTLCPDYSQLHYIFCRKKSEEEALHKNPPPNKTALTKPSFLLHLLLKFYYHLFSETHWEKNNKCFRSFGTKGLKKVWFMCNKIFDQCKVKNYFDFIFVILVSWYFSL